MPVYYPVPASAAPASPPTAPTVAPTVGTPANNSNFSPGYATNGLSNGQSGTLTRTWRYRYVCSDGTVSGPSPSASVSVPTTANYARLTGFQACSDSRVVGILIERNTVADPSGWHKYDAGNGYSERVMPGVAPGPYDDMVPDSVLV